MDDVFRALADPSRRRLLDGLNARGGQSLRELCSGLAMARQSVSKHLAVLEAANLVTTVRRGREKLHHLNAAPINDIAERWIDRYDRGRVRALADMKRALEDATMPSTEFVYKTYIHTTPERRWQVTFDIEDLAGVVKLTVVHGGFDPGSTVAEMVGEGWPRLVSDLKTLLETGETLPAKPDAERRTVRT